MFFNRIPVAWFNLIHNKLKLLVSICGISFSVVLMFVEIGFYYAFYNSATVLTRRMNCELILAAHDRKAVYGNQTFPRERLYQALMLKDIENVYPLYTHTAFWRNVEDNRLYPIRAIGIDPFLPSLKIEEVSQYKFQLQLPDTILIDQKSRNCYGKFYPGMETELAETRVQILDIFSLGTDFLNHGTVIMSDKNFEKLFCHSQSLDNVSIGLVKAFPQANLQTLKKKLIDFLPLDIRVYTKEEFLEAEKLYWKKSSPTGSLFLIGVFAAFVTGLIVSYQVLNSEVRAYLREFATMKAIGYTNRDIIAIVLQQSLFLSFLGFATGLIVSRQVCNMVARMANMPIEWTLSVAFLAFNLTIAMCILAGIAASLKVLGANPADLF